MTFIPHVDNWSPAEYPFLPKLNDPMSPPQYQKCSFYIKVLKKVITQTDRQKADTQTTKTLPFR